jgi:nicotinamidase-related amidase
MTSLSDRPNTALLILDLQRGVVGGAHRLHEVVGNVNDLVARARQDDVPVIWVQHSDDHIVEGSDEWQYLDEVRRGDGEPLVHKHYGDAFEATELEQLLAERKVGHVVVAGASTDMCIRSTLHGALARGYDATLVGDAHTLEDPSQWGLPFNAEQVIAFTNAYWSESAAVGRAGRTVTTADLDFEMPAP